jgi:hypothetical protein
LPPSATLSKTFARSVSSATTPVAAAAATAAAVPPSERIVRPSPAQAVGWLLGLGLGGGGGGDISPCEKDEEDGKVAGLASSDPAAADTPGQSRHQKKRKMMMMKKKKRDKR